MNDIPPFGTPQTRWLEHHAFEMLYADERLRDLRVQGEEIENRIACGLFGPGQAMTFVGQLHPRRQDRALCVLRVGGDAELVLDDIDERTRMTVGNPFRPLRPPGVVSRHACPLCERDGRDRKLTATPGGDGKVTLRCPSGCFAIHTDIPVGDCMIDPAWRTPDVLRLARAVHDGDGCEQTCGVLADALEEAGGGQSRAWRHLKGYREAVAVCGRCLTPSASERYGQESRQRREERQGQGRQVAGLRWGGCGTCDAGMTIRWAKRPAGKTLWVPCGDWAADTLLLGFSRFACVEQVL